MNQNNLLEKYNKSNILLSINNAISNIETNRVHLKGLIASSCSLIISNCFTQLNKPFVIVLNDKEEAAYFYNDLISLLNDKEVLFFPSSYKKSIQYGQVENDSVLQRTEVIVNTLITKTKSIIITYPEAIIEKIVTSKDIISNTLTIKKGDPVTIDFLIDVFNEYQFERTDFVYEPGQFAVRGSIIDVFSFANDNPFRIDFFGDEIESIRSFNVENQFSIKHFNKISIIPDIKQNITDGKLMPFFDNLLNDTILWFNDLKFVKDKIGLINDNTIQINPSKKEQIIDSEQLLTTIENFKIIEFGRHFFYNSKTIINFNIEYQPRFNKSFELLSENLIANQEKGYTNYIVSENNKQIERLKEIFHDLDDSISFIPVLANLHEGFIDHERFLCCYTDHQIFERYHRFKLKEKKNAKVTQAIKEINNLNPGDYVVHTDHGIGVFGGLERIDNNGKVQEAIRLIYKDQDILYVNIHSLHKISKYKGKDGSSPKIYKLGSGAWLKLKQTTKSKVKDIAKDLIALYAKRKSQKGFSFSPDSYLNQELEASFIYEDTPDQTKATLAVKKNMESEIPMDHLICGDVGFGKTEIAIRAAFKAVCDNKQVALLVPTTILALQHYTTFTKRFEKFPVTVDYISRIKKAKEQKEILKKLNEGKIDILIGTHRIIGNDVKFKNIGLLIIDEEQKFGVAAKEKLKNLKSNIDTLTLTATPIPRTLQFSLMGARDLSIINTPPPNRYPIITELHQFSEDLIKDAITYEISRNGQVYFIHNRVQNIEEIVALINRICPDVNVISAHGQLDGKVLEKIMLDFIHGDYDVLVATTIIESGLDIPNVNTIIINNAQNFGLSDLHQLRGRVGRSNKKAFCYLIAPPTHILTPEARRRLIAIENYSELGSGFNIALQDLDIRGAGNLLGGEQSGFIADIGFETYHKILNEALQELRENEFKDIFKDDCGEEQEKEQIFVNECQIDTDFEIYFPNDYIQNISERLKLYRELDNIENEEQLSIFESQLQDRFGKLPTQSLDLLNIVRLRWTAKKLGIVKIIIRNKQMACYFIQDQNSQFYQTGIFVKIIEFTQQQGRKAKIKEQKNKLTITFLNILNVKNAIQLLKLIIKDT
ncbi:MAG: transcription-repair coupling factor [Chlorobi bacterium]|nr:transcription-repair coupling factor [Chlorobiota bacterium]